MLYPHPQITHHELLFAVGRGHESACDEIVERLGCYHKPLARTHRLRAVVVYCCPSCDAAIEVSGPALEESYRLTPCLVEQDRQVRAHHRTPPVASRPKKGGS